MRCTYNEELLLFFTPVTPILIYNVSTMDTRFIYRVLDDLHYPVEKDEILLHAKLKGVGCDMYNLLLSLPYTTFFSCREIIEDLPLRQFEMRIYNYI